MVTWHIAITLVGYNLQKNLCMATKQFLQLYYELLDGRFYERFLLYGREFRQFLYYENNLHSHFRYFLLLFWAIKIELIEFLEPSSKYLSSNYKSA